MDRMEEIRKRWACGGYPAIQDANAAYDVKWLLAEVDRLQDERTAMGQQVVDMDSLYRRRAEAAEAENERLREQVADRDKSAKRVILGGHTV